MNEDQVIGSVKSLQWVLKHFRLNAKERQKLYLEIDGLNARLIKLREDAKEAARVKQLAKAAKMIPPPAPPPEPTPEQIAEREHKRIALEAKIESAKLAASQPVKTPQTPAPPIRIHSTYPETYREPHYNEEPSDFRPLPHFRGRE